MEQYISKSVLVAEIEKRWRSLANKNYKANGKYDIEISTLLSIKSFLDTIEVKEVDLEEEINHWQGCEAFPEGVNITPLPKAMDIVERTAKHFFELGLKTQKGE